MRWIIALLAAFAAGGAGGAKILPRERIRYNFYREIREHGTRRLFGGEYFNQLEFGLACAMTDRYLRQRCSCGIITLRWAVSSAHCLNTQLAYIQYTPEEYLQNKTAFLDDYQVIDYIYRHPNYKAVIDRPKSGADVIVLHHDVGLIRTRRPMGCQLPVNPTPINALHMYNPIEFFDKDLKVLGYGTTDDRHDGRLYGVTFRMGFCQRDTYLHCLCGVSLNTSVCSGDSGGPVLYKNRQVGITTMGPIKCGLKASRRAADGIGMVSVFTTLYNYYDMINSTIASYDLEPRTAGSAGLVPGALVLAAAVMLLARRALPVR